MGYVNVRTAFGGKGSNMPISCVAFGCRNKQNCSKNKENPCEKAKYASCDKGSQERVHIAVHRYCHKCQVMLLSQLVSNYIDYTLFIRIPNFRRASMFFLMLSLELFLNYS